MQRIKQVSGTSRQQVPQLNVTENQEGCSSDHLHLKCNLSYDSHGQEFHSPFVIYIYCDKLKGGMGNALIDTGSQVSLLQKLA
jgi:hypothetical protein